MTVRRLIMVGLGLMLANCSSSPQTHFFTLAVVPGAARSGTVSSPVTVAAVSVPAALDRREMVRRTGANTVEISDRDRWAAPLGEMTRGVLAQDLATRLPQQDVVLPGSPAPPHMVRIVVAIADFGPDAKGRVVLVGSWSVLEGDGAKPALRRDIDLEAPSSGAGAGAAAAGMSRLLGQLASTIATTLAQTP